LIVQAVANATESNGLETNSSSSPDAVQPQALLMTSTPVGERRSTLTPSFIHDIPSFRDERQTSLTPNLGGERRPIRVASLAQIPSFRGERRTNLTPNVGGETNFTRTASLLSPSFRRERLSRTTSLTPSFVSPSFRISRERRPSLTSSLRPDPTHETASTTKVLSFGPLERTESNPGRLDQSDRSLAAALEMEPFEPFTEGFSRAFKSIANDGGREGAEGIIGAAELRNLLHSFELYPSDDDLNELLQNLMGVGRRTKVDPGQGVTKERFFEMLRRSINTAGIRLDDFESIFSMLDIDGNERLGAEELETALTAMNERVPEQVLSSLLLGIGVSTRSTVTETELYRYINCHIHQDADGTCIGRDARSFAGPDRSQAFS